MKKYILTSLAIAICFSLYGQMNYQAIVFDDFGEPLSNTSIGVRSSIHLASPNGAISYQETQSILTDDFGRLNMVLGDGTSTIGTYAAIPRTGLHFLEIEVDVDGGTNYSSLSTIEIQSAFKADEIDPEFEASPASGITANDINNWNNPPGGGGAVIVINSTNYQTEPVNDFNMINIQDALTINSFYNSFNRDRLMISGGSISSTNGSTVDFGSHTTVANVSFSDVDLSGFKTTFINCIFTGSIEFPDECNIIGGRFSNCIATTSAVNNWILSIAGTDIDNSTITRVQSISNCFIEDSTIGESTSYNAENIHNCNVRDSQFFNPGMFSNNVCSDTYIEIKNTNNFGIIEGNSFDGLYTGKNIILQLNRTDVDAQHQMRIADNHFWSGSGSYSIELNGTYSNGTYDSMIFIDGNSFSRGTAAIDNNTTSVYLFVRNNTIQNTTNGLGVNSGAFAVVTDNFDIP